ASTTAKHTADRGEAMGSETSRSWIDELDQNMRNFGVDDTVHVFEHKTRYNSEYGVMYLPFQSLLTVSNKVDKEIQFSSVTT
ncbi:hypothetical protein S83_036175, partial [Arachis hypogaea]